MGCADKDLDFNDFSDSSKDKIVDVIFVTSAPVTPPATNLDSARVALDYLTGDIYRFVGDPSTGSWEKVQFGESNLLPDQVAFGEEGGAGTIQQSAAFQWINSLLKLVVGGQIEGSYDGNTPAGGLDKATLYIRNSKSGGIEQDGAASWHVETEDGRLIDLSLANIKPVTREYAYPIDDNKIFYFKGDGSVFNILGVVYDTTKIASVSYEVRRPAVGLPSGLDFQEANDLADVIAWQGSASNTIGGNAYTSPSAVDHIEILASVVFQPGWEGTADFTFIIEMLSI